MNHFDEHLKQLAEVNPVPPGATLAESEISKQTAKARLISASHESEDRRPRGTRLARVAALATVGALVLVVVGLVRGSEDDSRGESFGSFAAIAAERGLS